MSTCLGKSCSFGLPCVPFVNCCQFMYLVISLLVLRAGCGIWLYRFQIIAYLFTFQFYQDQKKSVEREVRNKPGSETIQINATNNMNNNTNEEGGVTITSCNNLIISDSMLKRIFPWKFSSKQITIKKFVSGGTIACSNFIKQQGKHYNPKKVLIHIGTRDLPQNNFKEDMFSQINLQLEHGRKQKYISYK